MNTKVFPQKSTPEKPGRPLGKSWPLSNMEVQRFRRSTLGNRRITLGEPLLHLGMKIETHADRVKYIESMKMETPKRYLRLQRAFNLIDTNNSGTVDLKELEAIYRKRNVSKDAVSQIYKDMDIDSDLSVSFPEFVVYLEKLHIGQNPDETPQKIFSRFRSLALENLSEEHAEKREALTRSRTTTEITALSRLDFDCINPYQQALEQPWYIILPTNTYRLSWDLFLLGLIFYVGTVTPIRIGFNVPASGFQADIEVLIDFFFVFDVFINFFTAYRKLGDSNDQSFEMSLAKVAQKYVRGWCLIDVLSSVPFNLITGKNASSESASSDVGMFSRALKLFRFMKLMKMLRMMRVLVLMQRLQEETVLGSYAPLTAIKLTIGTFAIAHWFACLWAFTAIAGNPYAGSWLLEYGLMDKSLSEKYLHAIYWSVMTLTTVGYGDVGPNSNREMIFATVAMIVGGFFYGYVIATLSAFMSTVDCNERLYRERMDAITSYMRQRHFPHKLFRRVTAYFRHYYERKTAIDERQILGDMSDKLREKVSGFLSTNIFAGTYLFQHLQRDAYARLLPIIHPIKHSPEEYVYREGDTGKELYIMSIGGAVAFTGAVPSHTSAKGAHAVRAADEEYRHMVTADNFLFMLRPDSMFGEFVALGMVPGRLFNVRCTEMVELYSITKEGLLSAFEKEDPGVLFHLDELANEALSQYSSKFDLNIVESFNVNDACGDGVERSAKTKTSKLSKVKLDLLNKVVLGKSAEAAARAAKQETLRRRIHKLQLATKMRQLGVKSTRQSGQVTPEYVGPSSSQYTPTNILAYAFKTVSKQSAGPPDRPCVKDPKSSLESIHAHTNRRAPEQWAKHGSAERGSSFRALAMAQTRSTQFFHSPQSLSQRNHLKANVESLSEQMVNIHSAFREHRKETQQALEVMKFLLVKATEDRSAIQRQLQSLLQDRMV